MIQIEVKHDGKVLIVKTLTGEALRTISSGKMLVVTPYPERGYYRVYDQEKAYHPAMFPIANTIFYYEDKTTN